MAIRNYSMLIIGTGAPAHAEPPVQYDGQSYTCGWQIYAVLGRERLMLESYMEHGAAIDFPSALLRPERDRRMLLARRGVSRDFPEQRNPYSPAHPATSAWGWKALLDAVTSLQENMVTLEPHGSNSHRPTWKNLNDSKYTERMRKGYRGAWDELALKRLRFFRRWLEHINGMSGLGAETVIEELRATLLRQADRESHDAKLSTISDLTEKFAIPLQQYLYSQGFKIPVHVVPEIVEQPQPAIISIDMES